MTSDKKGSGSFYAAFWYGDKKMVRKICKDTVFLQKISEAADKDDVQVAIDLRDTLKANRDHCVGMAANMIGVNKRIIIVNFGPFDVIMYNPVIKKREKTYDTKEGCLSLSGTRQTTRYETIEIEYYDEHWKKRNQTISGFTAQIIQHECDHLEGIII